MARPVTDPGALAPTGPERPCVVGGQPGGGTLVRGITWSADGPALALTTDDGGLRLPLGPGLWLRFRVEYGAGVPARYCLGFSVVLGPNDAEHHSCPTLQAAERGYQCGSCFARDDFRFMHDFHRSGIGPPGLKAYLAQPHWLYIATFADGTVKVGTASQRSKWSRLAEQGAIVARYVAHARDGSVVRMLEDAVSAELGLTQFVRGAAKFASLLQPKPEAELDAVNATASDAAHAFLSTCALDGFETVTERFDLGPFAAAVARSDRRIAYPLPLSCGEHGMRLDSMVGSYALVALDDTGTAFLADLAGLKGHKIQFGDYATEVPALQESLF